MRGGCGDGAGRSDGSDVCAVCYTVPNMLRFSHVASCCRAMRLRRDCVRLYGPRCPATPTPRRGHAALRRAAFPHGGCMVGVGMACVLLVLLTGA